MPDEQRARLIIDRVRRIPPGHVTAYGDLCPEAPRFAGQVLAHTHDPSVPWQRIVRADGSLTKGTEQRRLLEAEGVRFRGSRVDMDAAWIPAGDLA